MISVTDCVELGAKLVPDFIELGGKMFESKKRKQKMMDRAVERGMDRALDVRRAEKMSELEVYKRVAQADILGITEAELIGQTEIPPAGVRTALDEMQARGQAHFQNGRWYLRPPAVEVTRWAPRW